MWTRLFQRIFCKQMTSVQEKMLGITYAEKITHLSIVCDQYPRIGSVLMTSVNQGDPS